MILEKLSIADVAALGVHELDGSGIEYFVLPPLCVLTGSPYDLSQSDTLIDRAIMSTDAWIADGLEKPNVHVQHPQAWQPKIRSSLARAGQDLMTKCRRE
jgi:hypothetical protein